MATRHTMRKVSCRFRDRRELLDHLRRSSGALHPNEIIFLGAFDARRGEDVLVELSVRQGGASCRLQIELLERRRGPEELHCYRGRVRAEDRIWMLSMLRQLEMWEAMQQDDRAATRQQQVA